MTLDELKAALLEVSMRCGTTKRCSTCDFYNSSALECSLKDIPCRWWTTLLTTKTVDVILERAKDENT